MVDIKIADIPIRLNNRFPDLKCFCAGYETCEHPKIELSVSQAELDQERSKQAQLFTDGYLETVCMYRKLALEVLEHKTFLLHASVIEVDGAGYGFLARSGTGKTTQTRLWLEHFGSQARVINGDKPLIQMVQNGATWEFIAYGTPWCGKENMGCNASVPLKAMFILERSIVPACEPASQEYIIDHLFHQLLMPEKPKQTMLLLNMVNRLLETVPCYRLACDMSDDSVVAALSVLKH